MSGLLSDTKEWPGYRDPDEWSVIRHQGEAWLSDSGCQTPLKCYCHHVAFL